MVIDELITFVREELQGIFFGTTPVAIEGRRENILSPTLSLQAPAPLPVLLSKTVSNRTTTTSDTLHESVVMYVATETAVCFREAHDDFDGSLARFQYGTAVTVVSFSGRYAQVRRQEISGWILKDELAQVKSHVWPTLIDNTMYDALHDATRKLRLLIEDQFRAGKLGLPLQAGEYILYRLRLDNRTIIWPLTRPRIPGVWQKILRGVTGIHVGVIPKTDTIMEWTTEADEGRLAYVEKVLPDLTLSVSMIGENAAGVFGASILTVEEWRELRPVFIEIR